MSDLERERLDWVGALENPGARRIFGRMIYNATFSQSHIQGDALATAFREGVRGVGIEIAHKIEQAKPGEVAALLAETMKEMENVRRANAKPDLYGPVFG